MDRLSSISSQISPESPFKDSYVAISYTPSKTSTSEKLKYVPPNLLLPLWVLFPFFGLYKLLSGSPDTRLNMILLLIYQYFFHRKTKFLRNILGSLEHFRFFDGYQLIFSEPEASLKSSGCLFPFHPHGIMCYGLNIAAQCHPFFQKAEIVGSRMSYEVPWGGLVMKFYGIEGKIFINFLKNP